MNFFKVRASLLLSIGILALTPWICGAQNICNDPSVNAMVLDPYGDIYAFKGKYCYKLLPCAPPPPPTPAPTPTPTPPPTPPPTAPPMTAIASIEPGYPHLITLEFPGVPDNIDAAVNVPTFNATLFFKGPYVWKTINGPLYLTDSISDHFPRLPDKFLDAGFEDGPDFVVIQEFSYFRYKGPSVALEHGSISDWGWPIVHPDAALTNGNGDLFVFEGIWYYGIDPVTKQIRPGFPRLTGPDWFGC